MLQLFFRVLLSSALIAAVIAGLWSLDGEGLVSLVSSGSNRWMALAVTALLYALLLSIPFVPGMELGWLIIGLFGKPGIIAAWGCTVLGLALGFAYACLLRHHRVVRRLMDARDTLLQADAKGLSLSLRLLKRCLLWHESHPYLFVLLSLNVPGNWAIGGGGGIAWLSGITPKVRFPLFLLACAVATGVVPVVLLLSL